MFDVSWTNICNLFFSRQGGAAAGGANKKTDTSVKENVDEANEAGDQPTRKQSVDPLDDLISGLGSMQIK